MNWEQKALILLGLSEVETKVLKTLSLAKSTQDIAKTTRLSRTGIKYVLERLLDKGLVEKIRIGKRNIYIAISRKQMLQKLQSVIDEINIESGDRKGARIKISRENEFIIHVGAKEIVPAYQRIASINRNERIKAIQHHRSWTELLEKVSKDQLVDFNRSIVKNHLILDGMLNESAYEAYQQEIKSDPTKHKDAVESLSGRMADYTVFPDNFFDYHCEIWLFKTTTLVINWYEEVAIEITNENITFFLKDMFEFVKMGGRKIDHNEALREIIEKLN